MRPILISLLAVLPISLAVDNVWAQQKLKWTGAAEKSPTIEAEFVRVDGDTLILKKDGKEIPVPLSKLSLDSHLQALKLANPEAYAKPVPKAVIGLEATEESAKLLEYPFPENPTVEQYFDKVIAEMEAKNQMVGWHMLTPEMQTDVEDLVVSSIDQGGKEVLVQIRFLMRNLATIVHDKKSFLLASPLVGRNPQMARSLDFAWPHITTYVDALTEKSNWDAANFRSGNFAQWLSSLTVKLSKSAAGLEAMAKMMTPQVPGAPPVSTDPKVLFAYKVISQKEDTAVVQFTNPNINAMFAPPAPNRPQQQSQGGMPGMGQPAPARPAPAKVELVRVAGRWLPKKMVEAWPEAISQAKSNMPLIMPAVSSGLGLAAPMVSGLARAQTQQEFNAVIQQVTQLIPRGNMMSAGGMPGMGGFSGGSGAPKSLGMQAN